MKDLLFRWNLQRFADGVDAGGESSTPGNNQQGQQETGSQGQQESGSQEKKYTDEDVNRIVSRAFARIQSRADTRVTEATKLANLSATERIQAERDDFEKKYNDLVAQNTRMEQLGVIRSMLSEKSISVPDSIVGQLVKGTAEETKATVEEFVKAFQSAVQAAVVAKVGGEPHRGTVGGSVDGDWTKEKILAEKNRSKQIKLIKEHPDLFK